ncbi:hypothetical protein P7C71_g5625, partial [Lecanoromycetidae sp. Uapishka_2]
MPLAAKRRKIEATAIRSLSATTKQTGIQAFGKISKAKVQTIGKSTLRKEGVELDGDGKRSLKIESDRKRKVECIESALEQQLDTAPTAAEQASSPGHGDVSPEDNDEDEPYQLPSPPSSQSLTPHKNRLSKPAKTKTPTKGARSCLESFTFTSSSPLIERHATPPSSPAPSGTHDNKSKRSLELPDELQDLINLHSSFLTALSLHYAHNGSMTPADLRNLGPSIERAWRKRRVTTEDIQRILALTRRESKDGNSEPGPLYLSDYGHGKICVEITDFQHAQKSQRRPVNEEELNTLFVQNLKRQWTSYKSNHSDTISPSAFIASLP